MAEHGDKDAVRGTLGGTGSGGKVSGSEESDKPVLDKGTSTLTEPAQPNEEKADSDSHLESQEQDFSATSSVRDGSAMHTPVKPLSIARESKNTAVQPPGESLVILHLDVGQGACTLLLHSNVKNDVETKWTAVIDGGHGTPGRGQLARYLERMGRKLDAIFLSHYDADHADGIAFLIKWHRKYCEHGCIAYVPHFREKEMMRLFKTAGINAVVPTGEIKSPNSQYLTINKLDGASGKTENGCSLALRVKFDQFTYLTCGDLSTAEGEDNAATHAGKIDVLYCSHHGSALSSSDEMLGRLMMPPIAVISAGRNSYGHPNSETVARLVKIESRIYLTGCQYNRKYINRNYHQTEKTNLTSDIALEEKNLNISKSVDAIKNLSAALVSALIYIEEEDPDKRDQCIEKTKEVIQLLSKAADKRADKLLSMHCLLKSSENVKKLLDSINSIDDTELFGLVSGGTSNTGSIGVRVTDREPARVDVGFNSDDGTWAWRHHWRREAERLKRQPDFLEKDDAIGLTISSQNVLPQADSPLKFKDWSASHFQGRKLFCLSTKTPRQPGQAAEYVCRWCNKKTNVKLVFVECEFCRHRDVIVSYHDDCFLEAISGEKKKLRLGTFGGQEHLQKDLLTSLIKNRESDQIAITIPAKYEACYRCGVFRNKDYTWFDRQSVPESVSDLIIERRTNTAKEAWKQLTPEETGASSRPASDECLDNEEEELRQRLAELAEDQISNIDDQISTEIVDRRNLCAGEGVGVSLHLEEKQIMAEASSSSRPIVTLLNSNEQKQPSSMALEIDPVDPIDLTFADFYKAGPQYPFKTR